MSCLTCRTESNKAFHLVALGITNKTPDKIKEKQTIKKRKQNLTRVYICYPDVPIFLGKLSATALLIEKNL
jgi:hypothetical protein